MKELIRIGKSTKTGNLVVNARDLHTFLEVGKDFSNWFKGRIRKYGFIENVDFARICYDINGNIISLAKNGESDSQAFERIYRVEYALTLDCAKELSMVQNNERGRQARLYFIETEKNYRALREEKIVNRLYTMSDVAKTLNLSDYYGKVGRNELINILCHKKIFNEKSQPLTKYIKRGYFVEKPRRVTEDGLKWLNQMFSVEKTGNGELMALVEKLEKRVAIQDEKHTIMVNGLSTIVETLYFNKGGKKTEEQNRLATEHLHNFLETVKNQPKALN